MRKLLFFPLFLLAAIVFAPSWRAGAAAGRTISTTREQGPAEAAVTLPNKAGSVKFAVLGNSGTGEESQYQLAEQMAALHERFKYDLVILLGGNIYGSQRPQDRFYERVKPQKGITYFVVGSGGQLRSGHIDRRSATTARAFDTDHVFLAAEIIGDELYFNAISRKGETVDSGVLRRKTSARE